MPRVRISRLLSLPAAAILLAASGSVAGAQDEPQQAFVIDVTFSDTNGAVAMTGAVIAPIDEAAYWFSDGTDIIRIDLAASSADPSMPLLTLLSIEGDVVDDHIAVMSWAPLDIMVPAVVRTAEEAVQAFQGWIITQNSQAPEDAAE